MKKYLYGLFETASQKLNYINKNKIIFSVPKEKEYGDLATNYPLMIAKEQKKNPREVAKELIDNFKFSSEELIKVEIAGPGFINFTFSPLFVSKKLLEIDEAGNDYGKSDKFNGKKAQVEFVSANPTGPLTVGHGRNAVLGDTIANILRWVGYDVEREYYFNNAGRQMRVLGDSVLLRYKELSGNEINFSEEYYQGEYIIEIASKILNESGKNSENVDNNYCKKIAENEIFSDIKKTLSRININFDNFFNEDGLYQEKKIDETVQRLNKEGFTYDKDGAKWLALTKIGKEADKVIIKSTGEPTYRLPDIAYHITKFDRNFDLIVDIFGSDHIATYPDVLASLKILGYDSDRVKVIIHQFVTIIKDGEIVKMSTRKANFITLDELIDEVGPDVVRYFFLMRNPSTHLNFDVNLAKKNSDENPVFYLQYAFARICGIIRAVVEENTTFPKNHKLLMEKEEQDLIKHLVLFPEIIDLTAQSFDILILINYLHSLAEKFHKFYHEHRVISDNKELMGARLLLCLASKKVLNNGLNVLGINAPERM